MSVNQAEKGAMSVKHDANDHGSFGQPPEARGGLLDDFNKTLGDMGREQFKGVKDGAKEQLETVVGNKIQPDENAQKNALLDFSKDPETKNEKSMDAFKQTEDDKRVENEKFQATMASMTKMNPESDAASQADKRFDQMVNKNPHEVEPVKQAA